MLLIIIFVCFFSFINCYSQTNTGNYKYILNKKDSLAIDSINKIIKSTQNLLNSYKLELGENKISKILTKKLENKNLNKSQSIVYGKIKAYESIIEKENQELFFINKNGFMRFHIKELEFSPSNFYNLGFFQSNGQYGYTIKAKHNNKILNNVFVFDYISCSDDSVNYVEYVVFFQKNQNNKLKVKSIAKFGCEYPIYEKKYDYFNGYRYLKGLSREWYKNGNIRKEVYFKKAKEIKEGKRQWYKNGKPKFELIDNVEKSWYEDGSLKYLKNDTLYQEWYSNGQLKINKDYYDDGEFWYDAWYDNGQMKEQGYISEGKKSDSYSNWYKNGQKKEMGWYYKGEKIREYSYWYENGNEMKKEYYNMYTDGKSRKDSFHLEWYENGDLKYKWKYKAGKKHGFCQSWLTGDTLDSELNYKHGARDGVCKYYFKGKLSHQLNWEAYQSGYYTDSWRERKQGLRQTWYTVSRDPPYQLRKNEYYLNDKKHGKCQEWYSNGQIKSEIQYSNGIENGIYRIWFSNGELKEEGYYDNGKKDIAIINER